MSDIKKIFDTEQNIDIERLARLCRLSLSDGQIANSARELKKMADYTYPRLRSEDTSLPFSYCSAKSCLREDIAKIPNTKDCELILSLAPSACQGYVSVPRIIKEENDE